MSVEPHIDPDFARGVAESLREAFDPDTMMFQLLKQIQAEQRVLQTTVTELKEKMIRWEAVVSDVSGLKNELAEVKKELQSLKEEKQRRAGMQWLFEWTVKYVPWLAAAAASVWAIKSEG
jgi:hypothetical protein